MEIKDIIGYTTEYGFPMLLSWYLLVRIEGKLAKLTDVIGLLSERVAGMQARRRGLRTGCRGPYHYIDNTKRLLYYEINS